MASTLLYMAGLEFCCRIKKMYIYKKREKDISLQTYILENLYSLNKTSNFQYRGFVKFKLNIQFTQSKLIFMGQI